MYRYDGNQIKITQVVNVVFSIYRLLPVEVKGHGSKVTGIVGNSGVTGRGQGN